MHNDWVIVDLPDNNNPKWHHVQIEHIPTYHTNLVFPRDTDYRDLAAVDLPRCHVMHGTKRVRTLEDISEWVRERPDARIAYACCTQAALYEHFKRLHDRFAKRGNHVCCGDAPHRVLLDGDVVTWRVYFDLFDAFLLPLRSFATHIRFNVGDGTSRCETSVLTV